ncbi:hypothetical protein HAX54_014501 [Datura stramonium]|uniref:Uncharacterized protein n=1 Tax=Datura stramonium TaxID=4076 RepID=A0ABS8RYR1_DATST|nr:hypothetical protein [Datura stramonium]
MFHRICIGTTTFHYPDSNYASSKVDPYEEMERVKHTKVGTRNMEREIRNLKEAFKSIQVHKGYEGLEYEDLCVHPNIELYADIRFYLMKPKESRRNLSENMLCDGEHGRKIQPPMAKVRTPIEREVVIPKLQIIASSRSITFFDTKVVPWNYCIDTRSKEKGKSTLVKVFSEAHVPSETTSESLYHGLGVNLNGIMEPIQLPGQKYIFGLGYEPTPEEVTLRSQPVLRHSLLPGALAHHSTSHLPVSIATQVLDEVAENNLVEGLKNLFIVEEEVECNIILKDCAETPTIRDAELGDAFEQLTCTPSPVLWESMVDDCINIL